LAAREALDRCGGIATSALVSTSRKVKRKQILYNFPEENKKNRNGFDASAQGPGGPRAAWAGRPRATPLSAVRRAALQKLLFYFIYF
jgi:hypothetical protein